MAYSRNIYAGRAWIALPTLFLYIFLTHTYAIIKYKDFNTAGVSDINREGKRKLKDYFPMSFKDWIIFILAILAACAVSTLMRSAPSTDIYVPLIFVLAVLIIAILTDGYFYGILASVTSVIAVNWAFTYPYMKLNFSIYGYPLTFLTMLAVGVAVSTLTSRLKEQERVRAESEREKTRANLLRAVSHDLRTPLTSISGSIGLVLEDDTLPEEQRRELLEGAKQDAEWLRRMVENLLSITRMSDGQTGRLKMQDEMLEEVISETAINFKKRNPDISVSVSVPDSLFFVKMDAMLIEQVLLNLMDNAVIHGGNTSAISIKVTAEDGFAAVTVTDNGHGIEPKLLAHLFDGSLPFSGIQNDDSTRCMGIGLSVCKTIVQAHGGKISASNAPDGGARFRFTLPLSESDGELEEYEEQQED